MKKFILALAAIVAIALQASAQNNDTGVVRQFGDYLTAWATKTRTFSLDSLDQFISVKPVFRIGDNIMATLARQYDVTPADDYMWGSFMTCLQKEVDKGINISFTDIKPVSESMVSKNYKDVKYVTCNIRISGASNFNERDLFVIRKGKILSIQPYAEVFDKQGRRRIKVDLSRFDLDENQEGIGITYNYSNKFPVGISINYTKYMVILSGDLGVNLHRDIGYTTQKVDFTDLMNYNITRGEYDVKFYLTFTPSFYMKYFSIGYGFGFVCMEGTETYKYATFTSGVDGSTTVSTASGSHTSGDPKNKFMMRPNVKGFIPCGKNTFITLSVSYNWIPAVKNYSGLDIGVGLQFLMD